ncbi:MAG: glycosyltransferase family 39 protein [Desulfobacterales bacterium]|jgi:4-amino-4-deoxy-L-arabinose transferase-like glycosyltransferase
MLPRLSSQKILILFVLTLYFLLIGHKLLRLGIHGDGVEYASVARNMADGVGTFWKPYLDDTIHPVFHEHPPLVFWIQSHFFRLFGDGPYLEAFYGFFVGLSILGCMAWFWQRVRQDYQLPPSGIWWPMLLMVPLPIFTYMMQINRLVSTFTVLAMVATYAAYRSVVGHQHRILFSLLSGVLIYLGFIAKGPVAFFTFAVPILGCLVLKSKLSKAAIATVLALVAFAILFVSTFYLFPDSEDFWRGFWKNQVMASLKSERSAGDTHWYLVERWAAEMAVPVLAAGFLMLLARLSFRQIRFDRPALFFLLIGLASSLPFLISTRQHTRYIFQSYPFYVLSLAFLSDRIADNIEGLINNKRTVRIGVVVTAVVFFTAAFTSMLYKKDENKKRMPFYRDIYLQNIKLPERITISVCPADMIYDDWLFADMMRFYRVSLTPAMGNEYLLIAKDSGCEVPEGYKKIHRQSTMKYILYQKSPPGN